MSSPILKTIARLILPFVLAFALYLLLRGHISPGGGFIAGVLVCAGLAAQYVAFTDSEVRRLTRLNWIALAGIGLLVAAAGGIGAMVLGLPFLTSGFEHFDLPLLGEIEVSSAFIFDTGVFIVVIGAIMAMITTVMMEG